MLLMASICTGDTRSEERLHLMRMTLLAVTLVATLGGLIWNTSSSSLGTAKPFEGKLWDIREVTWDSGESRIFSAADDLQQWRFDPVTSSLMVRIVSSNVASSDLKYSASNGVITTKDLDGTVRSFTWQINGQNQLVLTRQGTIAHKVVPPGGLLTIDEVAEEGGAETTVATVNLPGGTFSEPRTLTFVLDDDL